VHPPCVEEAFADYLPRHAGALRSTQVTSVEFTSVADALAALQAFAEMVRRRRAACVCGVCVWLLAGKRELLIRAPPLQAGFKLHMGTCRTATSSRDGTSLSKLTLAEQEQYASLSFVMCLEPTRALDTSALAALHRSSFAVTSAVPASQGGRARDAPMSRGRCAVGVPAFPQFRVRQWTHAFGK
jgi:hypothetical protein